MNTNESNQMAVAKVDVRIVLAALWTAHFLLWTFGDMAALLQQLTEPAADSLLLFVAAPLAIIQASMIFFSLVGKARLMRWVNIVMAAVFLLFNVGYLTEAHVGWEYLLGAGYLLVNGLVAWYAWKWAGPEVQENVSM
jgi:hypothetical protein